MCVLVIKLRPSSKITSSCNCWAISSALIEYFCVPLHLLKVTIWGQFGVPLLYLLLILVLKGWINDFLLIQKIIRFWSSSNFWIGVSQPVHCVISEDMEAAWVAHVYTQGEEVKIFSVMQTHGTVLYRELFLIFLGYLIHKNTKVYFKNWMSLWRTKLSHKQEETKVHFVYSASCYSSFFKIALSSHQ